MSRILSFLLFVLFVVNTAWGKRIDAREAVAIGGIKQWMTFQGEDDQAPVLLFLHGGPGNSVMSYADKFTGELKKHFIVVHWDQRESGKTLALNKSPTPLTVSLFVSDAIAVINFLSTRFRQEKIFVMGHSWGGYLALHVAKAIPDKIKGLFAMNAMIHQIESERLTLQFLRDTANRQQNRGAMEDLGRVEVPFQNSEQLYLHRMWLSKLMGTASPARGRVDGWSKTWLALFNEGSQTDFFTFAPELKCPVYFLVGSRDYQTYFKLAESYYQQVVCPEKKLYWFTQSAHNPHLTETEKFQEVVISIKKKH